MACHLCAYMPDSFGIIKRFGALGYRGVDLFFVLSGFLITGILLDAKGRAHYFRTFYARRAFRIFPLYFLVLTAILAFANAHRWMDNVMPPRKDWAFYFSYLSNWRPPKPSGAPNILYHFWTLAIEEQFYLAWPLVVWLLPRRLLWVSAGLGITAAYCFRTFLPLPSQNTFCRMDALLFGALVALLVRTERFPAMPLALPYCSIGALVVAAALEPVDRSQVSGLRSLAFTLWAAGFSGLVWWAFHARLFPLSRSQRWWRSKTLRWLGQYSYGIYVFHEPLFLVVAAILAEKGAKLSAGMVLPFGCIAISMSLLLAYISYHRFERQFLLLRDRPGGFTSRKPAGLAGVKPPNAQ